MTFKKGESGNPSGRPKEVGHVKELAKTHTEEAIRTLASIMGNGEAPPAARVKASECLLDRAWGKAESNANVTVNRDVRELSTAEILASLAALGTAGKDTGEAEPSSLH